MKSVKWMVDELLPVIPVLLYQWIYDMKDGVIAAGVLANLSHVVLLGAGHLVPGAPTCRRWSRVGSESSWSGCLLHECNIFVMGFIFVKFVMSFTGQSWEQTVTESFLHHTGTHLKNASCIWQWLMLMSQCRHYLGTYPSGFWLFFQCLSINITEGWGDSSALIQLVQTFHPFRYSNCKII